jgi:hypothetical protein
LLQLQSKMGILKNYKGALEISFGWLFAILAGIVIIFLAIYLSSKLINNQQESISAETGTEIETLLNPLETSFESSQTTSITIPTETKINNKCNTIGTFGEQLIQLDQKSFNKWVETDVNVNFHNKYIFSNQEIVGKKFYIFSKSFSFPFKIADLMYITSANDRYCFVDAPNEIIKEISELNQSNLVLKNCTDKDIKICFGTEKCDINVDFTSNSVKKNNTKLYFADAENSRSLMYAAIFSDKTTYECQVKRLMMRVEELSSLYINKETVIKEKGCEDDLRGNLGVLSELARNLNNSVNLEIVKISANDVDNKNNVEDCKLW